MMKHDSSDNPPSQKHNGWHCCDLQPQGPRSRALYYSRNSLLHTWITYYTELPMEVPITPHRLENRYYAPPPITITGNCLTRAAVVLATDIYNCTPHRSLDMESPHYHRYHKQPDISFFRCFRRCFCRTSRTGPRRAHQACTTGRVGCVFECWHQSRSSRLHCI